jgi:alpha-galactosidase
MKTRKKKHDAVMAATPPMGWNSWNTFGDRIDEKAVRETTDAFIELNLRACGYKYIVIDDCWSDKNGRDGNGDLVPDPQRFPNGMKALADYVHDKGLKIGIYSDAADRTCSGYPGSYEFEEQDASLWASWRFDYLKYDYCNAPVDQESAIERYTRMGEALRKSGRSFLYSICEWGGREPHLWGSGAGGHMWRVTGDVFDSWVNIWVPEWQTYGIGIDVSMDHAATLSGYAGPRGWNDLDMLVVGLKGRGHVRGSGMSFLEYQTQMSLWCMACSPLMIGCDVRSLEKDTASLLLDPGVVAVNQDPLGVPGVRCYTEGSCDVWKKPLTDGSEAVAIVNRGSVGTECTIDADRAGLPGIRKRVFDIWEKRDIADFPEKLTMRVEPHQTKLLNIVW